MTQPIEVDLPHKLGKEEARRRIANNVHKLEEHIPGGAQVQSGWAGDQLNLDIQAMGQQVTATIDVDGNQGPPESAAARHARHVLGHHPGRAAEEGQRAARGSFSKG